MARLFHTPLSQFAARVKSGRILHLVFCAVYCIIHLSLIDHSSSAMRMKSQSATAKMVFCGCCGEKMLRAREKRHRSQVIMADMVPTPSKAQATPSKLQLGPSPYKLRFSPFRQRYSPYTPRPSPSRPRLGGISTEFTKHARGPVRTRQQRQQGMSVVHLQLLHGTHIFNSRAYTN